MISKELLSEVLGKEILSIYNEPRKCLHCIGFTVKGDMFNGADYINIHELQHKCKEWAKTESYHITTYTHLDTSAVSLIHYTNKDKRYSSPPMSVLSEPEAVFKACQWILNNKQVSND